MSNYIDSLKQDFRNFQFAAMKALRMIPSRLQYDMGTWLQHGPKRRGIKGHRGFGKSYNTAILACWILLCNPNDTLIVISQNQLKASEFVGLTRQLIELMPELRHLRPGDDDKDGAFKFVVGARTIPQKDPSVAAFGSTSMVTGSHANWIILDDLETPKNSETVEAREKLYYFCSVELESVVNPGGDIIVLGTPHNRDSLYNRMKLNKLVEFRVWPVEYPDLENPDSLIDISPMLIDDLRIGKAQPGDPTHPERFDEIVIADKKSKMGPTGYALQMLLDTSLNDASKYPLKLKDFVVMPIHGFVAPARVVWGTNPVDDIPSVGLKGDHFNGPIFWDKDKYLEFQRTVMFIDPAGTGDNEVGYAVGKLLNGMIFVPAAGGLPGGHDSETLVKLATIAKMHGVKEVFIEKNYGSGMYAKLLAPILARVVGPVAIEEPPSGNKMKEVRIIDVLEPALAQHRVVISPDVARDTQLMLQVSGITRTKGCLPKDDRVEALAGLVSCFIDCVAVDAEKVVASQAEADCAKAAKEFIESWKNPKGNGARVVIGAAPTTQRSPSQRVSSRSSGRWGQTGWGKRR